MPSCLSLFVYLSHKNLLLSSYSSAPMNDDDNDSSSNLTPHELESSDEESDVDEEEELQQEGVQSFGETALHLWKTRSVKLHHDYSIAGWALSVAPEVRQHASSNMTAEHRDAIERVVRRLHTVPCPNKDPKVVGKDIEEVIDLFWDEFTCFEKKTKPFDNIARWNTSNALQGKSYLWHEKYSLPYTSVLGFVACRVTSKTLGIGPCERNWAAVKNIKTGKRVHLGGDSLEKRAVLYASALIHDARIKQKSNENIEASGPNALFCDDDLK